MSDPLDFVAQDEVKTASRKRIIPMIATRRAVEQAISRLYGNGGTARVIEEMKREAGSSSSDVVPAQMVQDRRTLGSPPPPSASLTPSSSGPIPSGPATSIWSRRRVRWWCGCASMVCSAAS